MLNKVMLIGRLGQNPEMRYTTSGDPVTSFSLATSESYRNKDGNKQEKTEWHKIVIFGKQAEHCNTYLRKGSLVYIEGSIQTRKWQDKQGVDRYTTEINARTVQFMDKKDDGQNDSYGAGSSYNNRQNTPYNQAQKNYDEPPFSPSEASDLDDMPF